MAQLILGLQPRDKAAMLVVKTKEIFLLNLHQNRVHFPAERHAFVLDHQHGRRDVTCKPAIPTAHIPPSGHLSGICLFKTKMLQMPHGGASTFMQIPTVGPREEGKYPNLGTRSKIAKIVS